MSVVPLAASGHRTGSCWIAHRGMPVAELEGGSVVFFAVLLWLGTVGAGGEVDGRVISYAWNWVLGS